MRSELLRAIVTSVLSDADALPELLEAVARVAADYLTGLDEAPVVPTVPTPLPRPLPPTGVGAQAMLAEFAADWLPSLAASAGPRFQAFVTGGTTPAALVGDWLTSVVDQNLVAAVGGADALERQALTWIGELLGVEALHGAFVSGATTANLTCLATAREWAGRQVGVDVNEVGWRPGLARVLAGAAHSSVLKCASVLGIGRASVESVPLLPGREALDPVALEALLAEAEGPVIVSASAGTVNSGDFDDMDALLALRERYGCWLHVDAAFGAFAALDARVAARVARLGEADSVTVDAHKWLNVPYDSAVAFTAHRDLQCAVFANVSSYLPMAGAEPDFMHLVPENSRRFRGLAAWATLGAYGRVGAAQIVSDQLDNAALFADLVRALPGMRVVAPVHLNTVVFAPRRPVGEVLARLTASGEGFLTPTTYAGGPAIRAAFSNWRTGAADVRRVVAALAAADA